MSGLPANSPDDEPKRSSERQDRPRAISTGPPRMTPFRELQLVEAHREGDPEALTELLQAYQRRIYAVCYRMVRNTEEASDLTQDALVKVIEHLDSYDGRAKLSTWIIRITINCVLTYLRRARVRRTESIDSHHVRSGNASEPFSSAQEQADRREPLPLERIEQQERQDAVLQGLMRLEADSRAILVLRDMQGLDYEQISQVLDVPIGTVKSRLFRARSALRRQMERPIKGG